MDLHPCTTTLNTVSRAASRSTWDPADDSGMARVLVPDPVLDGRHRAQLSVEINHKRHAELQAQTAAMAGEYPGALLPAAFSV